MTDFSPKDITVIIPTRDVVNPLVIRSIPPQVKLCIKVDSGQGQTKIRQELSQAAKTKYVFLLDDDVILCKHALEELYYYIERTNIDAVCADKNPVAYNNFCKGVLKFKRYPNSFIKTGVTLWKRNALLTVMSEIPNECPKNVGDIVIEDIMIKEGRKFAKLNFLQCEHAVNVTRSGFFKYRYSAGVALAWYHLKWKKNGYWTLLAKMFFGIPLSKNQGVLIYRLSSTLGMIRGLFKRW